MAASARVLVVDDDRRILDMLREALAPFYEVHTALTGAAALEAMGQHKPDVVLLDYLLPDASGLTVLRAIKKLSPSTLVILITAFGSEDVALDSFRGGARDYIRKPFKLPELLARIERLLSGRRQETASRAPILLDVGPARSEPALASRTASLQRAIAYIDGHLDAHITLGQVAREAGMSESHFCRAFKGFTGVTFREHLARRRVARAADLLRDRQLSIKDVCYEVGLNDPTYFARLFRKLTGNSPSHYRAAH